jgi:hypothetical protein
MLAGHLGVALGARSLTAAVPLYVLVAASLALDLLWPLLLLTNVEVVDIRPGNTRFTHLAFVHYPWSHSLLMALVWGAVASILTVVLRPPRGGALLVGAVVVSHWLLDFITHRPDLPLWPGGPLVGLGLWNSLPGTYAVEGSMYLAGIAAYLHAAPRRRRRQLSFWAFVVVVAAVWIASPWAPPPPHAIVVAASALAIFLLPAWASRIERRPRKRGMRSGPSRWGRGIERSLSQ